MCFCAILTSSVAVLLVAAIHAVGIGVTPPAEWDTVTVLTLKLVIITLHITAVLQNTHTVHTAVSICYSGGSSLMKVLLWCVFSWSRCEWVVLWLASSDPSAQSWSPSHFHLPAIQRPLVQANSLSEHCLGTDIDTKHTSVRFQQYLVIF